MKKLKKMIAGMIAAVMLFSTCSNAVLYAAEESAVSESTRAEVSKECSTELSAAAKEIEEETPEEEAGQNRETEEACSELNSETEDEEFTFEVKYNASSESETISESETVSEGESLSEMEILSDAEEASDMGSVDESRTETDKTEDELRENADDVETGTEINTTEETNQETESSSDTNETETESSSSTESITDESLTAEESLVADTFLAMQENDSVGESSTTDESVSANENVYYEDKLGFTKKNTKIYTGQRDIFAGTVKYSKNATYHRDLTAVAYNADGAVEEGITCTFPDDKNDLYVSAERYVEPGKYTVAVYAGIGEAQVKGKPLSGTMYQANTSFVLTVEAGINAINVEETIKQAVVTEKKNGSFKVIAVGYGSGKIKQQKFTYEIKSAKYTEKDGYETIEPTDKVKNNISINKSGKVTIKKGYTVDAATGVDYIAIVVKAADFEGNDVEETAYVRILNTELVPTEIRLLDSDGRDLGTKFSADNANSMFWDRMGVTAQVVVLDQFGNNMNQYATITPTQPKKTAYNKNYVQHTTQSSYATLYIYKLGTFNIKAVATDGGKRSKTIKVTVTPQALEHKFYSVQSVSYNGVEISDYDAEDGRMTYSAPRGSVIKVYNGFEINRHTHTNHSGDNKGCRAIYNRNWYNWEYEIKGGKVKFEGNLWVITPTEKNATLTIWPKSQPRQKTHVTYTNLTWKDYDAAPKVMVKAGVQKLYANKYSRISDLEEDGYYDEETGEWETYHYVSSQKITYTYDSGDYDDVRITAASKKAPYFWISDFNSTDKTFQINVSAAGIKPGSYKYKVTFYKKSNNSKLQLAAKPATITIKVYKAPKIKIAPSYTLKTDQADSVALKLTPNDFLPDFDPKLLNANVNGKANNFRDYFEVVTSTDNVGVTRASIRLKSDLTTEQKAALKEQKKITGYIKYSYYYGYDCIEHAASKITITIK